MNTKLYTALGLMSGTSMDGIDAAIIRTDGLKVVERLAALYLPFGEAADAYKRSADSALTSTLKQARFENHITRLNAIAALQILEQSGISAADIDVTGFHGQTILHVPADGITVQLANGALFSALTNIRHVITDFRKYDMARGGQGAPLVPIYHWALAENLPIIFLNIGGVANLSFIPSSNPHDMQAFDCAPGNAPLNDLIYNNTGKPYDKNGQVSAQGKADTGLVAKLMQDEFFKTPVPKSLDRNYFTCQPFTHLPFPDAAASICEFIAEAVAYAVRNTLAIKTAVPIIVCGGGRRNPVIMAKLKDKLGNVAPIESIGINGDMVEAEAFAYLAVRRHLNLPISFPGTTGITGYTAIV